MKMVRYVRKFLAAALMLVLLCQSVLAVGNGFNAGLEIQRTEGQIVVTVVDSDVLAAERPTLTIPCDFPYAQVTFNGQIVTSTLAGGHISFPVTAGGVYTVTKLDAPAEEPGTGTPVYPPVVTPPASNPPESGGEGEGAPDSGGQGSGPLPFTDVAEGQWYYEEVRYVVEAGLMTGVSATEFAPNAGTSRAMIWMVLARMRGADVEGGESPWYQKAMAWAVDSGISDGADPNGLITREQLVTMLYRLAGEPGERADLSGYPDAGGVSPWAADAMRWAVAVGLIRGDENRQIMPRTACSRAQTAAMIMRYEAMTAEAS